LWVKLRVGQWDETGNIVGRIFDRRLSSSKPKVVFHTRIEHSDTSTESILSGVEVLSTGRLNVQNLPGIFYGAIKNQGYGSLIHNVYLHISSKFTLFNFNAFVP